MAMNRAQLLSIINSMADDKLLEALSAAGIDLGDQMQPDMDLGAETTDGLEPWSAKEVQVDPANKPSLFDKNKFVKQPPVVVRRPQYMPQTPMDMGGDEDAMAYVTPEGTI